MTLFKPGPLNGITVIDLTRVLAGPFCTLMLAELGARVIKIEEPGKGDDSRQYPPIMNGRSGYFSAVNRNKESIALDLKNATDRDVLDQLLEKADIIAENFRPGVMDRLGYSWDSLHARFPKLLYLSISGYGHTGPYAPMPAYDMVMQGVSGMMSITGEAGGRPCRAGISIADSTTGMFAAIGVNAALLHRERTGEATKIDMAMFDCMMSLLETPAGQYLMGGVVTERMGSAHPGIMPFEAFSTSDGFLTISCGNDKTFGVLCNALDHPEWTTDPRYAHNIERVENRPALVALIEAELKANTTKHWLEYFANKGVPASPINTIAQALEHPQLAARNMIVRDPDSVLGDVRMLGSPFKMSAFDDVKVRRLGPDLDQDRAQIFKDFGISELKADS